MKIIGGNSRISDGALSAPGSAWFSGVSPTGKLPHRVGDEAAKDLSLTLCTLYL